MSIGQKCRKILGPVNFQCVGKVYRSFFIDLKLAVSFFPTISPGEHLLDVGAGDGALVNHICQRFPAIKISMIDVASSIGEFVDQKYRHQINLLPATSIANFKNQHWQENGPVDHVLISDVVHHILPADRSSFFRDLTLITDKKTTITIIDVEPGSLRSFLSYLSDKYISGDKAAGLVSKNEIVKHMQSVFPGINFYETNLSQKNAPNYCLVFSYD